VSAAKGGETAKLGEALANTSGDDQKSWAQAKKVGRNQLLCHGAEGVVTVTEATSAPEWLYPRMRPAGIEPTLLMSGFCLPVGAPRVHQAARVSPLAARIFLALLPLDDSEVVPRVVLAAEDRAQGREACRRAGSGGRLVTRASPRSRARVAGVRFDEDELRERIGSGPANGPTYGTAGGVAVLPIVGILMPKASIFSDLSAATSMDSLRSSLRAALADERVSTILLDVDSPGGSVSGIAEAAAALRAARSQKRVVAAVNPLAASAGYHLASQAGELVVTPSGTLGSIGVFGSHDDLSGAQAQAGIKTTLIHAGRHRVEESPYGPLSEEARAEVQRKVDAFYDVFVADVAKGRGVSEQTVAARHGVKAG
jgi:signal peptide peptidase SppA